MTSQQQSPFQVKIILTSNGERLPVILSRQSGIPLFDATTWTVKELRGRNVACNTIIQALRSLALLYIILDRKKIDLSQRLTEGMFLFPDEIEEVATACNATLLSNLESIYQRKEVRHSKKILSLEKVRMSMTRRKVGTDVDPGTAAIRLKYIREFLVWRMNEAILKSPANTRSDLISLRDVTDQIFGNKIPQTTGRNHIYQRLGIDKSTQALLIRKIIPTSTENPWCSSHTKIRNELIVCMLLSLGIRRSELLGLRIKDISTQGQEIQILRRPDDISDPRLYEPNAKTRDRLLSLDSDLFQKIRSYISFRRTIIGARKHDFLIVANGSGAPLSISEFSRLFKPLQDSAQDLKYLVPHVLRHTFFENLCEDLDKNKIAIEQWEPILRRLGGWNDNSTTPSRYTKRYAQHKADEAMLSMQKKLIMNISNDK